MGEHSKILTQNDLLVLNAALGQLASNLDIHVNESLSVAHGINAINASYYDSKGDQWGNTVIVFDFGEPPNVVRLYVPAQVTNLGPASTGSGLAISSASPTGSFTSPGIPLGNKPLVTFLTTEALEQAIIYENLLLAHTSLVFSDTGALQCHGGRTYTSLSVLDSLGHTVGRKYITLGINGTAWQIPCDEYEHSTGSFGPPQLMRGINLVSNRATRYNAAACKQDAPQYGAFWLTANRGGSLPYTVTYQVNALPDGSSATWNNLSSLTPGYVNAAGVSGRTVFYDASISGQINFATYEGSEGSYIQQFTVRAKISNAAGDVYTNYCRFYAAKVEPKDSWWGKIFGIGWFSDSDSENQGTWNEIIPGSPALQP
ncbi:MAG: hypothetical protein ACOYB3_00980 [Azonexus sp.]